MMYLSVKERIKKQASKVSGKEDPFDEYKDCLVVNPYFNEERFPWQYSYNLPDEEARIAEQEQMDIFYMPLYQEVMNERYTKGKCELFEKIYIATTNICNGHCGFCPAGTNQKPPFVYLKDELIDKIIDELMLMDFKGKISLHGVNEPLLDKRIVSICRKFHEALPDCSLQILTNGKLLTKSLLEALLVYLSKIDVHIYSDTFSIDQKTKDLIQYCTQNIETSKKVQFILRKENEILSQKGYGPCGRTKYSKINSGCIMPFTTLSILATGEISYCDSDYLGIGSMGNIDNDTIVNIWNNDKFNKYREAMLHGRMNTDFCKNCDFF